MAVRTSLLALAVVAAGNKKARRVAGSLVTRVGPQFSDGSKPTFARMNPRWLSQLVYERALTTRAWPFQTTAGAESEAH